MLYESINMKLVLTFLAVKKNLPEGKLASYVTIRKYNDAILWGCHQAGESLPLSYIDEQNIRWVSHKSSDYCVDPISSFRTDVISNMGRSSVNFHEHPNDDAFHNNDDDSFSEDNISSPY